MKFYDYFCFTTSMRLPAACFYILFIPLLLLAAVNARAQSARVRALERKLTELNTNEQYDRAVLLARQFLDSAAVPAEDAYYANLYLSDTYKRLFDYDQVFLYLDRAEACIDRIPVKKAYYSDHITALRAFALFDIRKYGDARKLMDELAATGYSGLDLKTQAYLAMQQAYLSYLEKDYAAAEARYDTAMARMQLTSPCDLPVILAKKISLYGDMKRPDKMQQCYRRCVELADSCHITKYRLYAVEIMRNTYEALGDYRNAFRYFATFDSLNTVYNADGFRNTIKELEIKYETAKKEQALSLQRQIILSDERLIALLIAVAAGLALMIALTVAVYRRKKMLREKQHVQRFTKQLLDKTEEERKRIATDLHDSINNELLLIKSGVDTNPHEVKPKIDRLINEVRSISRNLHPVLFEELGLQDSIEQLAERVQQHHRFILNTAIDYRNCLSVNDELQLYRIVQEAVNNILKYAKAEAALISITQLPAKLIVEVKDNGIGFNVEEALNGKNAFGLHNIMERSHAINGTPRISSGAGGTTIHIEILLR